MDWEDMSVEVLKHVEDCLPVAPASPAALDDQPVSANTSHQDSWHRGSLFSASPESNGICVDKLKRDEKTATFTRDGKCFQSLAPGSEFLQPMAAPHIDQSTEMQHVQSGTILRRMELIEERLSSHEEELGSISVICRRTEGIMIALQSRQDELNTKIRDVADNFMLLDRRNASTESALSTTISQGQMLTAVRSALGQFREQVENKISAVEQKVADSIENRADSDRLPKIEESAEEMEDMCAVQLRAFQAEMDRTTLEVKGEMAKRIEAEQQAREACTGLLQRRLETMFQEVENSARLRQSQRNAEVAALSSQTQREVDGLSSANAEEVASVRRELKEALVLLGRRVEEVRDADSRRMDEVSGDLKRARDVRADERREIWKELSGIQGQMRHAMAEVGSRRTSADERLRGVEGSLGGLLQGRAETRDTIGIMETKLKMLQLEVQAIHGITQRTAIQQSQLDRMPMEKCPSSYLSPNQVPPQVPEATAAPLPVPSDGSNVGASPSPAVVSQHNTDFSVRDDFATRIVEGSALPSPNVSTEDSVTSITVDATRDDSSQRLCQTPFQDLRSIIKNEPDTSVSSGARVHKIQGKVNTSNSVTEVPAIHIFSGDKNDTESQRGRGVAVDAVPLPTSGSSHSQDRDRLIRDKGPEFPAEIPRVPTTGCSEDPSANTESETKRLPLRAGVNPMPDCSAQHVLAPHASSLSPSTLDPKNLEQQHAAPSKATSSSSAVDDKEDCDGPRKLHTMVPGRSDDFTSVPIRGKDGKVEDAHDAEKVDANVSSMPADPHTPRFGHVDRASGCGNVSKTGTHNTSDNNIGDGKLRLASDTSPAETSLSRTQNANSSPAETSSRASSSSFSEDESEVQVTGVERREGGWGGFTRVQASSAASQAVSGIHKTSTDDEGSRNTTKKGESFHSMDTTPRSPRSSAPSKSGMKRSSSTYSPSGPSPVSGRERSSSKDSGVATAQCEFCLRRYLRTAMASHLQVCELRLVRCPFQCGIKVLVRNLEKHKSSCSLRFSDSSTSKGNGLSSATTSAEAAVATPRTTNRTQATTSTSSAIQRAPPPPPPPPPPLTHTTADVTKCPTPAGIGKATTPVAAGATTKIPPPPSSGDPPRTVTCMRCHESLPFHLVPEHGSKCKGKGDSSRSAGRGRTSHGASAPPSAPQGSSPLPPSTSSIPKSTSSVAQNARGDQNNRSTTIFNTTPPRPSVTTGLVTATDGESSNTTTFSSVPPRFSGSKASPNASPEAHTLWGLGVKEPSTSKGGVPPKAAFPYPYGVGLSPELGSVLKEGRSSAGLLAGLRIPPSPPRPKKVELWTTRQVTSWLREKMRPPRADVISRFHDGQIDGAALLELTDRDLLHPTEGLGIIDADIRRQILELVDALVD